VHDLPTAQDLPKPLFSRCGSASQSTRHTGSGSRQSRHARLSALSCGRLLAGTFRPPSPSRRGAGGEVEIYSGASLRIIRPIIAM
jgi:hypothetical protein